MDGSQARDGLMPLDRSRAALDFAHRLLSSRDDAGTGLDDLLRELHDAFAVRFAGMADLQSGLPLLSHGDSADVGFSEIAPWERDADLLTRIRQSSEAVTVVQDSWAVLVVGVSLSVGGGWLLWIGDSTRHEWTDAEKTTLVLIAHLFAHRLKDEGTAGRWGAQLERSIRQQNLEQAAVLSRRLAHDFGNVLTSILGFSELALAQPQSNSAQSQRFINEIYRSAQAGAQLTHQLQLFSRRQATFHHHGSLAAVLSEEGAKFKDATRENVRLVANLSSELPAVALDQEYLRQVFGAIFDNAREAVAEQGTVTVTVRSVLLSGADCLDHYGSLRPGTHLEVCVSDSGPGLSAEAERRLFVEPFYTSKSRRRGFGLAIAFGMLSAHHGGLSVANGPLGGVSARVLLPLAEPSPALPAASAVALVSTAKPIRDEKLLIVDDDPMILQFVSMTLEQAGYRIQAVSSADKALDCYLAAGDDPFQMVLSDVVMPRVSGVELARRLLARHANARILFMSGQVSHDYLRTDFSEQPFDLLKKPFHPEGLLRAVRDVLDRAPTPRSSQHTEAADPGPVLQP